MSVKKDGKAFNRLLNRWGQLELNQEKVSQAAAQDDMVTLKAALASAYAASRSYCSILQSFTKKLK